MPSSNYIGIDIGGTKISAGLVDSHGALTNRSKSPTPDKARLGDVLNVIKTVIDDLLEEADLSVRDISGIGAGVPGIVGPDRNKVIITPNIDLSGASLGEELQKKYSVRAVIDNDVNLGLLGEKYFGAARDARHVIGIFPGTGVGGAIILNGELWTGAGGAAAEIGHMIIDPDGPPCSCGNKGCLEAFAGRWAIERDIREAIKQGQKTTITELAGKKPDQIKSKMLKQAIKQDDKLVKGIIDVACLRLGQACISLRHIFNPDLIVFGGGVIEACGFYMLPQIEEVFKSDRFFTDKVCHCRIAASQLGDDAIILGAAALISSVLENPLASPSAKKERSEASGEAGPSYPYIYSIDFGMITIDNRTYDKDVYILADGKVQKRNKDIPKDLYGTSHKIGKEELKLVCGERPDLLIIGSGHEGKLELLEEGKEYLNGLRVDYKILPTKDAVEFYNQSARRKALLVHVTC